MFSGVLGFVNEERFHVYSSKILRKLCLGYIPNGNFAKKDCFCSAIGIPSLKNNFYADELSFLPRKFCSNSLKSCVCVVQTSGVQHYR